MKKAYNETWVDNIDNQDIIREWYDEKVLSKEQYVEAQKLFPVEFYQPNIFIEFGLFIFTNLAISATFGFLAVTLLSSLIETSIGLGVVSVIYGVSLVFLLEYFIRTRKLYRSGTDNAFLYVAIGSFLTAVFAFTDFKLSLYSYYFVSLLIFIPFLLRYGDPFVGIAIFVVWICFWFTLTIEWPIGKLIVPFVIMGASVISYVFANWWKKKDNSCYYTDAQICIETGSLITFYLGGNYMVVREGNALLNGLTDSSQISFASLFYLFTVIIPFVYLFFGLKNQDRKMVMVGLAAFGFSIFTYRYYFSVMPLEWALTLGGAALVGFSVWGIWFLRTPKWGLTYQQTQTSKYRDFEAFLVSQALPHQGGQGGKMKFGGGDFGGGGSGDKY
ncbi:hypothetical protein [Emticicia sp. C21]|uniref:hypothetical protein n=1 Tax=Emticicia sp. C21 TaxID=2302915 RepID=UPI000E34BE4D|nr:hypothetical protein [Emticicia sp. C21]RFS18012.1 hypothetical protein D0T08_01850 [Emticicia sp. C21]